MKKSIHFLNGELVKEDELLISPRDIGFSRGYAVFDFLRTYNGGQPFCLKKHIARLFKSAGAVGMNLPWKEEEVFRWVIKTLTANNGSGEKFIKIIVSGGVSEFMYPAEKPTIIILIDEAKECPVEWHKKGVRVKMVGYKRYLPEVKTGNYIEGVRQMILGKEEEVAEPVYFWEGEILEGSNSNVFAVIKGKYVTSKNGILKGITREVLLEILGEEAEERDIGVEEFLGAEEIFLTSSIKEICPVTFIDGRSVGGGRVGKKTKEVMERWREIINDKLKIEVFSYRKNL